MGVLAALDHRRSTPKATWRAEMRAVVAPAPAAGTEVMRALKGYSSFFFKHALRASYG